MTTPEPVLIASDLHLDGSARRETGLRRLLDEADRRSATLYLLGDVFHYWFGPQLLDDPLYRREISLLRARTEAGTRIYFVPGNRDFLIDEAFAAATGVAVLPEVYRGNLRGECVCLTHGDIFSTRDLAYQRMKRLLRSKMIVFLARSLPRRLVGFIARSLRRYSERVVRRKSRASLAPDLARVADFVRAGARTVVCGHFHEARSEQISVDAQSGRFWVLEPYEEHGYCLLGDEQGWSELRLARKQTL